MEDNYFNYIINNCSRKANIRLCCSVYKSMENFIAAVNSEFNGYTNYACDKRVINAVYGTFRGRTLNRLFLTNAFTDDALLIYNRCKTGLEKLLKLDAIDHEYMFDVMTDYCWLQASIEDCLSRKKTQIILLDQPNIIRLKLRNYLSDVYQNAIDEGNECLYINEAIDAQKRILTGLYPFKYEQSKKYAFSVNTIPELEQFYKDVRNSRNEYMAIFLSLTATSILADEIWRSSNE